MSLHTPAYLLKGMNRQRVEATLLDGLADEQLEDTDKMWQASLEPIIESKCRYHRRTGQSWKDFVESAYRNAMALNIPIKDLPENPHWIWSNKSGYAYSRSFAVECEGNIQGVMFVLLNKCARMAGNSGKFLVYVDYLGTAPWNNQDLVDEPKFRGAGLLLMRTAVQLSIDLGRDGVVGLHSLPRAEDFYGNIRKCGLTNLGTDADYENLSYFEMHRSAVQEFITRGERR